MTAPRPMRDPLRALRGIASGLLVLETIVVLLAIPVARFQTDAGLGPAATTALVLLAVALFALCAVLRKPWAGPVGTVLQVAVVATGFFAWPMFVLGLLFGGMWVAYTRMAADLARTS